jgi:hypothetical protein
VLGDVTGVFVEGEDALEREVGGVGGGGRLDGAGDGGGGQAAVAGFGGSGDFGEGGLDLIGVDESGQLLETQVQERRELWVADGEVEEEAEEVVQVVGGEGKGERHGDGSCEGRGVLYPGAEDRVCARAAGLFGG